MPKVYFFDDDPPVSGFYDELEICEFFGENYECAKEVSEEDYKKLLDAREARCLANCIIQSIRNKYSL